MAATAARISVPFAYSPAVGCVAACPKQQLAQAKTSRLSAFTIVLNASSPVGHVSCQRRCYRVAASSQQVQTAVTQLKEALVLQLESAEGYMSDEATKTVGELEKLNPNPDYTARPDLYKGCFEAVKVSFKGTGKQGEGQKKMGLQGASLTLGRLSFNTFKPADLEVITGAAYNHVGLSGTEYELVTEIQVGKDLERPVDGLLIVKGEYTSASSVKMGLVFLTVAIAPRYPDADLALWRQLFEKVHPGMDERGLITAQLTSINAFIDYLFLDEELRITRGSMGNINVVRRIKEPAVPVPSLIRS